MYERDARRTDAMMENVPEEQWRSALIENDEAKPFHIWAFLEK